MEKKKLWSRVTVEGTTTLTAGATEQIIARIEEERNPDEPYHKQILRLGRIMRDSLMALRADSEDQA